MQEFGKKNPSANLADLGLNVAVAHWNLSPEDLVNKTIELGQGELNDTGAIRNDQVCCHCLLSFWSRAHGISFYEGRKLVRRSMYDL